VNDTPHCGKLIRILGGGGDGGVTGRGGSTPPMATVTTTSWGCGGAEVRFESSTGFKVSTGSLYHFVTQTQKTPHMAAMIQAILREAFQMMKTPNEVTTYAV
jgi:hypothetical protein